MRDVVTALPATEKRIGASTRSDWPRCCESGSLTSATYWSASIAKATHRPPSYGTTGTGSPPSWPTSTNNERTKVA